MTSFHQLKGLVTIARAVQIQLQLEGWFGLDNQSFVQTLFLAIGLGFRFNGLLKRLILLWNISLLVLLSIIFDFHILHWLDYTFFSVLIDLPFHRIQVLLKPLQILLEIVF